MSISDSGNFTTGKSEWICLALSLLCLLPKITTLFRLEREMDVNRPNPAAAATERVVFVTTPQNECRKSSDDVVSTSFGNCPRLWLDCSATFSSPFPPSRLFYTCSADVNRSQNTREGANGLDVRTDGYQRRVDLAPQQMHKYV